MASATDQLDNLLENITTGNDQLVNEYSEMDTVMMDKSVSQDIPSSSKEHDNSTILQQDVINKSSSINNDNDKNGDYQRQTRSRSPQGQKQTLPRSRSRSNHRDNYERRRESRDDYYYSSSKRHLDRSRSRSRNVKYDDDRDSRRRRRDRSRSRSRSSRDYHNDRDYHYRERRRSGGRYRSRSRSRSPRRYESDRYREERGGRRVPHPSSRSNHDAYAQPPPGKNDGSRLFIGNLPYECSWQELKDFCRKYIGEVAYCNVLMNSAGRSKGCGVVEFVKLEDAKRALVELNGKDYHGRALYVREDMDYETRERERVSRSGSSSALVDAVDNKDNHYNDHRDKESSTSPSTFRHVQSYPSADSTRSSTEQHHHTLSSSSNTTTTGCKIFVGNLPFRTQWQDLKDIFKKAGNIVRADVLMTREGRSKGAGVLVFETTAEAQAAIDLFNGTDIDGRKIEVREDKFSSNNPSR